MFTLHGTRALVTGGSRGIGLGYAEALSAAGCSIVLNHYRDESNAREACARFSRNQPCFEIDADVGCAESARSMVARAADMLGGLDIVVSNAGICKFTPFLDLDDAAWQRHVDVNFSAGFWVAQQASRIMVKAGKGGRIIFTTSAGAFRSNAAQTHYCATKGGLHLLAQGMALELGPHKITVNAIAPGWIKTSINREHSNDAALVSSWLGAHCPAGRLGEPRDLQAAVLFLASREASYVTGATISVDGGWNAQL